MPSPAIVHQLRQAAVLDPHHPALFCDGRTWSYAELYREADALAAGLTARGIRRGDRVAFLLPNGPELVFLDLACLKLGAIGVPLNVRLKGAELAWILGHSKARLCIAHVELYPNLAPVRSELTHIEQMFLVGATGVAEGGRPFADLLADARGDVAWNPSDRAHPAAILYTSGTTARPKGVTHTHGSLGSAARSFIEAAKVRPDDVVFGMLSMGHIFGYTLQLLSPLSAGATVVIAPSFDAPRVKDLLTRHRVTHLYGLPVMFEAIAREPDGGHAAARTLRYCLAGGDSVSKRLSESVEAALGVPLHEGCGMTEVLPYALNRPGIENRIGSIGPPSIGMSLRLVDEAGHDVPEGAPGQVLVKSEALTAGYWEDPAATAEAFVDGWFRTGDLARRDADGYYWFVGRSKEIIVRGGSNIAPLEVEAVVAAHPAVQEAVIVGAPHPTLGEMVVAFVVLKKATAVDAEALRQFVSERIAAYKVPEQIRFLDDLPRGPTGKVQRRVLKQCLSDPHA